MTSHDPILSALYEQWLYLDAEGCFDYSTYRRIQVAANQRKADEVWVRRENIQKAAEIVRETVGRPRFGLCHGTRRGMEQIWFREFLDCPVIGTEISPSAASLPDTIVWDFHEVKPEWLGAVDFIYSNSFDHTYDPQMCLDRWMSCLKADGVCIIEHSSGHVNAKATDPFGVQLPVLPYLILRWGNGAYSVRKIVEAPVAPTFGDKSFKACFVVIMQN